MVGPDKCIREEYLEARVELSTRDSINLVTLPDLRFKRFTLEGWVSRVRI